MGKILIQSAGLVLLIVLGYVLKKVGLFKQEDSKVFSNTMVYITFPAVLIHAFQDFQVDTSLISMFFMNLILCGIMAVVGRIAGRKEDPKTCAMYILCMAGLNVGSFSIPFIQTFFPERMMSVVMFDIGNAISCCGLIFSFAVMQMNHTRGVDLKLMGKTLVKSFAFDLYVVLLLLQALHVRFPEPVYEIAGTIGAANPVIVMLMLGILFEFNLVPDCKRQVLRITAIRVSAEVVLAVLIYFFLPMSLELRQVLVLLILGPCTSMTPVFCGQLDCDPDVYGTVSSLTIAISIVMMVGLAVIWAV